MGRSQRLIARTTIWQKWLKLTEFHIRLRKFITHQILSTRSAPPSATTTEFIPLATDFARMVVTSSENNSLLCYAAKGSVISWFNFSKFERCRTEPNVCRRTTRTVSESIEIECALNFSLFAFFNSTPAQAILKTNAPCSCPYTIGHRE